MPLLAIVAYPTFEEKDRVWIESLRTRHDPQASRIAAHFTFVFPVELDVESVVEHAAHVVERLEPIAFVVRDAVAVTDAFGDGSHVFLVPEAGRAELAALHGRLYSGVLAPYRRAEIPFQPHITVAAFDRLEDSQQLAASLAGAGVRIPGTVSRLQVVDASEHRVRTIAELPA